MAVSARVRTRWFPLYSAVRSLLTALSGVDKGDMAGLLRDVWDKAGSYSARVDWSDPSTWIPERLSGASADLAWKIWEQSNHTVNPRHIYGAYLFITHYELVKPETTGRFTLTESGREFINAKFSLLARLDSAEGLHYLLNLIAVQGRCKRGDLIPEWAEFLGRNSEWRGPEMIRDSLRRRLANLIERSLIIRQGGAYTVTDAGIEYLSKVTSKSAPMASVLHAVVDYNATQREALKRRLKELSSRAFEFLVAGLVEAMGYSDVLVTPASRDKGVDVKATGEIGTTPIRHVFQVKHWSNSVGRRVVTELRGSLVEHDATLGTIVTMGKFSRGAIEASLTDRTSPIGLIDGDKLTDLLIEYSVGMRRRSVELYELDIAGLDELSTGPLEDRPVEE